jgi:putative transposase
VINGVTARGTKRFSGIGGGVRKSTQRWHVFPLNPKSRGTIAPKLAIGDGAMGRLGRNLSHDPPAKLPARKYDERTQLLAHLSQSKVKADAISDFDLFIKTDLPKYSKASMCLQKDRKELRAFFDFPAQHRQRIRISNPIESAFATIRHRAKRAKGCLTHDGMLHMFFKLWQCAK